MKQLNLEEIKKVSADILAFIDEICRQHDLKYFIMFGTLIGAVRHKGYIPWDDDVDICMFRDDYIKLMKIFESLQSNYIFIGAENDPNYYFSHARVVDKRTELRHRPLRHIKNFGVFVDIFPMDNAPSFEEKEEWFDELLHRKQKMWKTIPTQYDDFYLGNIKRYFRRFILEFRDRHRLGVKNFSAYRSSYLNWIESKNKTITDYLVFAETDGHIVLPKAYFSETIDVEFEGMKVMAPIGTKEVLTEIYGDYMKLPPVEHRVSGHSFIAYKK